MATYCFTCPECGAMDDVVAPIGGISDVPTCACGLMKRDYKREGVAVTAAVGSIRRSIASDEKSDANVRDILPTSEDFLRKHRGNRKAANQEIKEWNARHEPADSKGNRYRPQEV